MGVLQLPHPLPIKTDSDNNILIFSPELDGPARACLKEGGGGANPLWSNQPTHFGGTHPPPPPLKS